MWIADSPLGQYPAKLTFHLVNKAFMYLICDLGIVFFFNLEPRVISAHFQRCRNDPGLEITNHCLFVTKKVPVPFATVIQFSPQQINCQSLYGPITDSYLFWGTSLANFALNLKKKKKKKKKRIRTETRPTDTVFCRYPLVDNKYHK